MTQDILEKYGDLIAMAEAQTGVPANLIAAQIKQESGGNPGIFSPAGAGGLMQLMPETAAGLGVSDVTDPEQNILGGATYMAQMLDMFGGDVSTALAAYNAGPGNVKKYGGIPPFKETQNYVKSILGNLDNTQKPTGTLNDYLDSIDDGFATPDGGKEPGIADLDSTPDTDSKDFDSYIDNIDLGLEETPAPEVVAKADENWANPSEAVTREGTLDNYVKTEPAGSTSANWLPESILSGLGVNTVAKKIADTQIGKSYGKAYNEFEAAGENAVVDFLESAFKKFGVETKRGPRVTPQDIAKRHVKIKTESEESVKANPLKSLLTQAAAFSAGPGKVLGAITPAPVSGGSKLLNALKIVGGGATQGAGYEAVTNPDATMETITKAGAIGGTTAGLVSGGLKTTQYLADKVAKGSLGKYLGINKPEVIKQILDEPGLVSPTTASKFEAKVQSFVQGREDELQTILQKSDVKINVGDLLNKSLKDKQSPLGKMLETELAATGKQFKPKNGYELLQSLIKNKGSLRGLTKTEKKVLELSRHGDVPITKLNELKRVFWKLSRFKQSGDPTKELERAIGEEFRIAIERALPNSPVAKINQRMGAGIEVLNHLASKKGDIVDKLATTPSVLLNYISGPIGKSKMAYDVATKTGLGATTTASISKSIQKLAKDRPEMVKFLSILFPQIIK